MRYLSTVVVALVLAGCASVQQETWSKSEVARSIVARDVMDCDRASLEEPNHGESCAKYDSRFPVKSDARFDACMRARGYERLTSSGL